MTRLQRLGALAGLISVLSLGSCSDDEPPEPAPSPTASDTEATSPTPTETTEPTVEPAAGEAIVGDSAFIRVPEGYQVEEFGFGIYNAESTALGPHIQFADLGFGSSSTPRELAALGLESFQGRPDISYDAEVDGAPAYVAVGRDVLGPHVEYGAVNSRKAVVLSFSFGPRTPEDEQEALIASVLASFTWN